MDALKKSALNGHVPAVQSLEDLVRRGKLPMQEIYPTIVLLMSLDHAARIDADDWITTPHATNLISCFGMLAVYFSKMKIPTSFDPDSLSTTLPQLWNLIQEWCMLLMARTRIPDVNATPRDLELVELIERIITAVSPIIPPRLYRISLDPPRTIRFFQRLVHFWIRCGACPNVLVSDILPFIATAAVLDETVDSTTDALKNTIRCAPSNEVTSTLVSSYAKVIAEPVLDTDNARILVWLTSFSFGDEDGVGELPTSVIAYWSARLLRRVTSLPYQNVGKMMLTVVACETLDNLQALSFLGYMWARDVLRADLLHALLNMQVFVCRLALRSEEDTKIANMLACIRPFLIWPSIRALVRRSLRCIRSSGILDDLDLTTQAAREFLTLQDVTISLSEGYTFKKDILSVCANPECPDPASLRRQIKYQRCLSCRHCVYCSSSCQRQHWTHGHNEYERRLSFSHSRESGSYLGSACDEEWIQYQAHCDIAAHGGTVAALSTEGKDTPVLVMDYRSFVENRAVDLSLVSFNDFPKRFSPDLYKTWYRMMKSYQLTGPNDRIVLILAPVTLPVPYCQITILSWLSDLDYTAWKSTR